MRIADHFDSKEFRCKCGKCEDSVEFTPPERLLLILEDVREVFGSPVQINSCKRCKTHNASIGGSKKSQHLTGTAVDIVVENTPPNKVYAYLDDTYGSTIGLGSYNTFTHVDVRHPGGARW